MRREQWGPGGGDPVGTGRGGEGREPPGWRRTRPDGANPHPPPPGSALRRAAGEGRSGRRAELAAGGRRGPAV